MAKPVLALQPSEIALFNVAAQFFSAYVVSGHVTGGNENDMLDRSLAEALKLVRRVEEAVQSDQELG